MLLFGDLRDGIFGGVMVINAVIGIMSELRAKRTLDSLAIVDAPQASVLRNGEVSVIPARASCSMTSSSWHLATR